MDVQPMCEKQCRTRLHIGFKMIAVNITLQLIRCHHHQNVSPFGSVGNTHHFQAFGFCLLGTARAFTQRNGYFAHAAIAHVQGMRMALATVSDNDNFLAFDQINICVAVIINAHGLYPSRLELAAASRSNLLVKN